MSLLFRNPAPSPRSAAPPSAFPTGLQAAGSRERSGKGGGGDVRKRVSRTDMDFEQALRTDQTVLLREGRDVNRLGDQSPTPSNAPSPSRSPVPLPAPALSRSRSPAMPNPATPTIVPPTPSPSRDPPTSASASRSPMLPSTPTTASTTSSTTDVFYDAEDPDYQTKRRSLYRSPGTASSPDLATLVRKAKQRGVLPTGLSISKDKRSEPPPPLPTAHSMHTPSTSPTKTRQRSSTSSFTGSPSGPNSPMPSSAKKNRLLKHQYSGIMSPSPSSPSGHDWAAASSNNLDGGTFKNAKSSMRAKTTAFWGKMLGQGSVRDRSKSDAYSSSSSLRLDDVPPVPPIPSPQQRPVMSPVSDVFSRPTSPPPPSNLSKPLPSIDHLQAAADRSATDFDFDDQSVVVVNHSPHRSRARSRSRSPNNTVRRHADPMGKMSGHSKRRSMSVGEIDLKKAMAESSSTTPLPLSGLSREMRNSDSGMKGVLSDFEGQLSEFDRSISSGSLDLQMPGTPLAPARSYGQGSRPPPLRQAFSAPIPTFSSYDDRPGSATTIRTETTESYVEAPTVTVGLASANAPREGEEGAPRASPVEQPVVPPRSSSLHSPLPHRTRGPAGPRPFPPSSAARTLSNPRLSSYGSPHGHSPSKDSNRLWVNPRSAAFSSEPSLITGGDDGGISPPLSALSQQDLTSQIHGLRRFPSNVTNNSQDPVDVETKGKDLATRCWDEDEEFLAKEKIAEWLGGIGVVNKVALRYYMDRFDFGGLRLDLAFRRFCAKLFLKAETQQVDRILEEFSRRYWECNPGNLFGNPGVVHAVSYSLLLLNTDLHVADIATRMSKNQFVRNTLSTIQMQLQPTRSTGSTSDLGYDDMSSTRSPSSDAGDTVRSRPKRSDSITSWNSITRDMVIANLGQSLGGSNAQGSAGSSGILVKNDSTISVSNTNSSNAESKMPSTLVSSITYDRNWESDMESLLKDMYSAIKNQQVLQPLSSVVLNQGPLMRNRSLRVQPDRLATLKRGSIRGIQSILGAPQNAGSPYSSNSSVDGRASPAPSFATSAHEGVHGSTLSFMTPALGFASNLSHTIIRETQEDDDRSHQSDETADTTISISDEELALLGAPWAKEGMLCRKQYNESAGKRAKSKAWLDVFVVIQQGELNMFTFGGHAGGSQGVVGGGNWLENANSVGTVRLAHSLAHALPPPGYNRQRPHCMVLTLSNGAVYFFQAGTEELVNEWVSTCNYWAARQSKEPLTGGVSNMEYGWNRVADPLHHGRSLSDDESIRATDYGDNLSVRSGRSSKSKFGKRDPAATVRGGNSPWADRTHINEWKEPQAPSVPSNHDEEGQLEALKKHVKALTKELQEHNEHRGPMMALYPARSSNSGKALANWEKRSKYLLTEIVKYELYIESLQGAMALRFKKRGEKALERALHRDALDDGDDNDPYSAKKWKGRPDEETIAESDETTGAGKRGSPTHRREMAEVEEGM
ncbi:hypothetical protein OF83DRAFT_498953 [Amylostereum chailletii]|nr:hypothetical protein OF83DRAFT_498953 [Amylostereum chailletii]